MMEVPATREAPAVQPAFDAVIVGAGFAGMYMLHRLRELGFRARVLEAGTGVGGTWYWNRYPGARCDVESIEYSYEFSDELQQEWTWTERYATQPEILRYANHVADRFDLRRDIRFDTRVRSAHFDDATATWALETERRRRTWAAPVASWRRAACRADNRPNIPGMESFARRDLPHRSLAARGGGLHGPARRRDRHRLVGDPVDPDHRRAGGSTCTVFQRTPNYTVPAHNAPLEPERVKDGQGRLPALRARAKQTTTGARVPGQQLLRHVARTPRNASASTRSVGGAAGIAFMGAFNDLLIERDANETAAEFVRGKIRETVHDPEVAELLSPKGVIGCKRLCVDTGYYETFNRAQRHAGRHPRHADRVHHTGGRASCADEEYALDASCSPPVSTR